MPSTSALKERKKESKKERTKEQRELTQNQNKKIYIPFDSKELCNFVIGPKKGNKATNQSKPKRMREERRWVRSKSPVCSQDLSIQTNFDVMLFTRSIFLL